MDNLNSLSLQENEQYMEYKQELLKKNIMYILTGVVVFIGCIISMVISGFNFVNIAGIILSLIYLAVVGVFLSSGNKPELMVDGIITKITESVSQSNLPKGIKTPKGYEYEPVTTYKFTVECDGNFYIAEAGIKNEASTFSEGDEVQLIKFKHSSPVIIRKR